MIIIWILKISTCAPLTSMSEVLRTVEKINEVSDSSPLPLKENNVDVAKLLCRYVYVPCINHAFWSLVPFFAFLLPYLFFRRSFWMFQTVTVYVFMRIRYYPKNKFRSIFTFLQTFTYTYEYMMRLVLSAKDSKLLWREASTSLLDLVVCLNPLYY